MAEEIKGSALPAAALPLTGAELVILIQTGDTVTATVEETGAAALPALSAEVAARIAHEADTTAVHGIADTAALATTGQVTAEAAARAAADAAEATARAAADTALSAAATAHAADTTAIHGIADTANLVVGSDPRLTDTRTPTDNSVTQAKVPAGALGIDRLAVDPRARATHTGDQPASSISDLTATVRANRLDQMAAPTAPVNLNSQRLTNGVLPVASTDVITKEYADGLRAGLLLKGDPVRVMVGTNVNISAPGAVLDTIAMTVGDRVLLTGQVSGNDNGIYVWQGAAAPMTRAADANTSEEMRSGTAIWVTAGSYEDQRWALVTADPINLGVTAQVWTFDGGLAGVTAGDGLTKTGHRLDVGEGTGLEVLGDTVGIAAGGVGTTQLADLGVTTGKLADGAATQAKLAADAVVDAKVAAGANIAQAKIAGLPAALAALTAADAAEAATRAAADTAEAAARIAADALLIPLTNKAVISFRGDCGAVADGVSVKDAAITSGTAIVNAPSGKFTAAMVGLPILVVGAGPAGADLATTILSYQLPTRITLATNASTTIVASTVAGGLTIGTDNGPALQLALDKLALARGGTLQVEPGAYALFTAASKNMLNVASHIRIQGHGTATRFLVRHGRNVTGMSITNCETVDIDALTFVGTFAAQTDAHIALHFATCLRVTFTDCHFYGLANINDAGGSTIKLEGCALRLIRSNFLGCSANSGLDNPTIDNLLTQGVYADSCHFIDYGVCDGIFWTKTGLAAPAGWIRVRSVPAAANNAAQPEVILFNCLFDEGAVYAIAVQINTAGPKLLGFRSEGCRNNAGIIAGYDIRWTKNVVIKDHWAGFQTGAAPYCISMTAVDVAELENVVATEGASKLFADSQCGSLTLRDCNIADIAGVDAAVKTRIITAGAGGVVLKSKAGPISDADFARPPPNDTVAVDTAAERLYVRIGGAWSTAALTRVWIPPTTPRSWFKADELPPAADGTAVATWADAGSANLPATQGTAGKRPLYKTAVLNGLPGLLFDGTDDGIQTAAYPVALAQPFTVVVVAKRRAAVAGSRRILSATQNDGGAILDDATNWGIYAGGAAVVSDGASDNVAHIFAVVFNGATSNLRVNGGAGVVGNPGAEPMTGLRIGSHSSDLQYWDGHIFELAVIPGAMSLTDLNLWGARLNAKWGAAWATAT